MYERQNKLMARYIISHDEMLKLAKKCGLAAHQLWLSKIHTFIALFIVLMVNAICYLIQTYVGLGASVLAFIMYWGLLFMSATSITYYWWLRRNNTLEKSVNMAIEQFERLMEDARIRTEIETMTEE